jgi:hypothetical protein
VADLTRDRSPLGLPMGGAQGVRPGKGKIMMHKWRALVGVAVAAALAAAPVIAAPAMADDATDPSVQAVAVEHKVVVCKYVTTPGEGEVLQTGQNPIEVDENALGSEFTGTFPYTFNDAQGRSIAIGWVGEGLDITDCPGYRPPQPDDQPLYETRNGSACTQPLDGTRTDIVEERSGTRTFVWDGDSWEPQDTWGEWMLKSSTVVDDPACAPNVVPLPTLFDAPPVPPTCELAGALPALATFAHVTLSWDRPFSGPGMYTLTATAIDGYTFADGTTVKTKVFTVEEAIGYQNQNPEAPCYREVLPPPPVVVTLATPSIHDVCGTANDTAELPADSQGVDYSWSDDSNPNELDAVAVLADGYVVEGTPAGWVAIGEGEYLFAQPDFTDVACPVVTPTSVTPPTTTGTTATTTGSSPLAITGGTGVGVVVPIGGALALMLGIGATMYAAMRRRA